MKVLYVNNDGGGFADYIEVTEGTSVDKFFSEQMPGRNAEGYLSIASRRLKTHFTSSPRFKKGKAMYKNAISARCKVRRRQKKKRSHVTSESTKRKSQRSNRCKKRTPSQCQICKRKPGARKKDRSGSLDPNPQTPLGKLQRCRLCGLWACPDCLHETDCCFREEDEHEDDPNWAPPGWKRVKDGWIADVQ